MNHAKRVSANTQEQGMRLDSVFAMINGAEGTRLKLTMMRNGAAFAVSLTRGQVRN